MKFKLRTVCAFAMLLLFCASDMALAQRQLNPYEQQRWQRNKGSVSIIGGGIGGTYIRYATDLANVLDDVSGEGMRVLPIIGHGGGQNVLDILFLKGIDMGLTQQDHLSFWKRKNPQLYGDIENRVHYITKLYNSEYHLIARKDTIKTFEDLRGKKVNFWRPWSATDLGGQTIFKLLDIEVDHTEYIDTPKALEMVKNGEIAATTLLAGAPISAYAALKPEDGLHIVPLGPKSLTPEQNKKLLDVYLPTKLTHKQYPNMIPEGEEVESYASGVVLAVYNWQEKTDRYEKIANFVEKFFSKFEEFKKPARHPKWKEVNLAANIPGWTRFKPAQEWLDNPANQPKQKAFAQYLGQAGSAGKPLTEAQKKVLFQQFSKWWETTQRQ